MKLPNATHESRPWRIREIVQDFTLEDVWALPMQGDADDFPAVLELLTSADPADADSLPTRFLWRLRDLIGKWFDLGEISAPAEGGDAGRFPIPGTSEASLSGRLPEDLRGTAAEVDLGSLPFVPLYLDDDEFAAEVSNRTMHGVMHLAWAERGQGHYQAQMAVYVKPNGFFGKAYMTLIRPFRYLIVYPALMRQTDRMWNERRGLATYP